MFSLPGLQMLCTIRLMQEEQQMLTPSMKLLRDAVLAATDPLHLPVHNAVDKACQLIRQETQVRGIIDAMIERDECYFEAIQRESPAYHAAVHHALELIPLLIAAGDSPSPQALASARYNCDPLIQQAILGLLPRLPL